MSATTSRRAIVVFTDDTEASEALLHALHMMGAGPVYVGYPEDATYAQRKNEPQPQPVNRKTSVYQIDFDGARETDLDEILEFLADVLDPVGKYDGPGGVPLSGEQAGSGTSADQWRTPYVRVRVANDDVARAVALEIAGDREFSIRTGLGAHQRWLA